MCYDDNNYNCIVDFFKSLGLYNEEYFHKIRNNTIIIMENSESMIGFIPSYKFGKLIDFRLFLPELIGLDNILIYIHEYGHALFPEDKSDIFPNTLEALFMKTYLNIPKKTNDIINKTETDIKKSKNKIYKKEQKIKIGFLKCL